MCCFARSRALIPPMDLAHSERTPQQSASWEMMGKLMAAH